MNIITADFNWVSFLIVVVGVIAGIVQSNKKKLSSAPVWQEPDFTDEMEEEEKKKKKLS